MLFQVARLGNGYWDWVHKPSSQPTFRLFENKLLESLSKTPWYAIPLFWLPIIVLAAFRAFLADNAHWQPSSLLLFMPAGLALWTLLEYSLHRFLFHAAIPKDSAFWSTFHFMIHGLHHKFPMDKHRLVFPPAAGVVVFGCLYVLHCMMLGQAVTDALLPGALSGYVCYDLTHYYLHHGQPKPETYLGFLKGYHRAHHYKNPDLGYGITSTVWDKPFGTEGVSS